MNIRDDLKRKAHRAVGYAVKKRILIRPTECQLCGNSTERFYDYLSNEGLIQLAEANLIVAHHYLGYEEKNFLVVWWICQSCNYRIGSRHDGSLSLQQAEELVRTWTYDSGRDVKQQ